MVAWESFEVRDWSSVAEDSSTRVVKYWRSGPTEEEDDDDEEGVVDERRRVALLLLGNWRCLVKLEVWRRRFEMVRRVFISTVLGKGEKVVKIDSGDDPPCVSAAAFHKFLSIWCVVMGTCGCFVG